MTDGTSSTEVVLDELRRFAGDMGGETCPIRRFHGALDGPWNTLIIRELLLIGPRRFSELQAGLPGISPKTLSARLKRLVELGIATRTDYGGVPPKVVYDLTDAGRDLAPVFHAMGTWADQHLPSNAAPAPHPRRTPRRG